MSTLQDDHATGLATAPLPDGRGLDNGAAGRGSELTGYQPRRFGVANGLHAG